MLKNLIAHRVFMKARACNFSAVCQRLWTNFNTTEFQA